MLQLVGLVHFQGYAAFAKQSLLCLKGQLCNPIQTCSDMLYSAFFNLKFQLSMPNYASFLGAPASIAGVSLVLWADWFEWGRGQAADFFLRPPTLKAGNFEALLCTDPIFTEKKDPNLLE